MKPTFLLTIIAILIVGLNDPLAQTDTILIYPSKDSYISSNSSSSNFGTNTTLAIGRYANRFVSGQPQTYQTQRGAIYFDFSTIPSNAIITSARLMLFGTASPVNAPVFKAIRMTSSWTETGITWSNSVSPTSIVDASISSTFAVSGSNHTANVKDQVQQMVAGAYSNYGWMILLSSGETASSNIYQSVGSRENATASLKPRLEVEYYIPMEVQSATIVHESGASTSDASIAPILTDGPGGTYTYEWKNSVGSVVGTNINLTSVTSGWYGLKVTSSVAGSLPFYYSFLVGNYDQATSFNFNPGPDYIDDAILQTNTSNPSVEYIPYPNATINEAYESGSTGDYRSMLKFRVWIDQSISLSQAELNMRLVASSGTNPAKMLKVTQDWSELNVAQSNKPTYSTTEYISMPTVSGSNVTKQFNTLSSFQSWQTNNVSNYGWLMQLDTYNNTTHYQYYYSSDYATTSSRPSVDFAFNVEPESEISWLYSEGVYVSPEGSNIRKNSELVDLPYSRSKNILYGKNEFDYKNGSIEFILDNVTDDLKKIGFDVINSNDQVLNEIDYGLQFVNGTMTCFNQDTVIDVTVNIDDTISIGRDQDSIVIKMNGATVYQYLVDPYEELQIEAQLTSLPSSFSNISTNIYSEYINLNAQIDNINNLIYVDTILDTIYHWMDGDVSAIKHSYIDGVQKLSIRDQFYNTIKKEFSVGEPITWSSFYKSRSITTDNFGQDILEFLPGSSGTTGTSKSSETFGDDDPHWISYVTNDVDEFIGIGILSASQSLYNMVNLKVGIAFFNHVANVSIDGGIVKQVSYNSGDVFLIYANQESRNWEVSKNGAIIHLVPIPSVGNLAIGGLVSTSTTLQNMSFSTMSYESMMTYEWNETLHIGTIGVDLGDVDNLSGNVNYIDGSSSLMSPLPVLYESLSPVIGRYGINATTFSSGNYAYNQTYETSNEIPGNYYVSAFDDDGQIIFQKEIYNAPDLTFDLNNAIVQDKEFIKSTSSTSRGIICRESISTTNLNLKISSLLQNEGLTFGLITGDIDYKTFSDLKEGFIVENGLLSTIDNGSIQLKKYKLNSNSTIYVKRNNDELEFILNDISILKKSLSNTISRQVVFEILGIDGLINFQTLPMGPQPFNFVSFFDYSTTPSNCYSGQGKLSIVTNNSFSNFYQTHHVSSVTLKDVNNNVIQPINANNPNYDYANLLPGTYQLIFEHYYYNNITGLTGVVQFTTVWVEIDSRIEWTNFNESNYEIIDESITSTQTPSMILELESADSKNLVGSTFPYYVDFQIKETGQPIWFNVLSMNWGNESYTSSIPNVGILFVVVLQSSQVTVVNSLNSAVIGTYPIGTKFRLKLISSTSAILQKKNLFSNTYTTIGNSFAVSNAEKLLAFVNHPNCGFKNISSNLPCPNREIYAKLERKLTGQKYKVYQDKIQFYFDQEYESSSPNLNYFVYKNFDPVNAVLSNTSSSQSLDYGDNRYGLDVSSLSAGEYILEVINNKSEKFYLRFNKLN